MPFITDTAMQKVATTPKFRDARGEAQDRGASEAQRGEDGRRDEVNAPGGPTASYQTYSVGPVLGYKAFLWKGLYANAYARYWPNVASSLPGNKIALQSNRGTVSHDAHDFGVFANFAIGYAFDL